MSRCRLVVTEKGNVARVRGAPAPAPESRAAIEQLIDAATADLARRRAGPEAASKGNPKGNRIPFGGP